MNNEALQTTESVPITIDGTTGKLDPTPREIHLKTIDNVRLQMACVYRDMRRGVVDTGDGSKLVYVLAQIGKMIEMHDFETRLNLLEGNKNGND